MTTTKTKTLSSNATKLLNALKNKSMWETETVEVLFPKPIYVGTMDPKYSTEEKIKIQTDFWQWEENLYGNGSSRPVNGTHADFKMNVEKSYSDVTYEAFTELKKAGLAYSRNTGYNTYSYHAK